MLPCVILLTLDIAVLAHDNFCLKFCALKLLEQFSLAYSFLWFQTAQDLCFLLLLPMELQF